MVNTLLRNTRLYLLFIFAIVFQKGFAQQQPQYTQYMYGNLIYNPGYAGISGGLNAQAFGRWQWVGFEGAPNTQTLAIDSDFPGNNIGLGLVLSRDELAITSSTNVTLNYAYHINFKRSVLSMGVSGSLSRLNINYNDAYVLDDDAKFARQTVSTSPNFGLGLFYDRPNFWMGVSVPNVLNNELESNGETFYGQSRHFFLSSGFRLEVSPRWRLEPSVLVKAVEGTTIGTDVNLMAWVDDRVAVGAGYRPTETASMMLHFNATENLGVGYAYDYILNDELANISSSSHEVLLSYKVPWKRRDSDKDGLADKKDDCPRAFGPAFNGGCPTADSDDDGVPDYQDRCPKIPGKMRLKGCPDRDNDGIIDSEDKCPDIKGSSDFKGCRDSDRDGVIDSEDDCPELFGKLNGCPDSDFDGVSDVEDHCNFIFGVPELNGCPAIKEWEKRVLDEAIANVQFEPGKDVITYSSFNALNKVVNVLYGNSYYHITIKGYTDNSGNDQMNLRLSKDRAESVKTYLVNFGIDESKIEAIGYGEADPVADNNTASGRAKNRRVEFELHY
ncbi:MAG: PorP/SprF family type IX secretion system membrane protein [Marinoscillum sp.]